MYSTGNGDDEEDTYGGESAAYARSQPLSKRKRAASIGGEEMLSSYQHAISAPSAFPSYAPQPMYSSARVHHVATNPIHQHIEPTEYTLDTLPTELQRTEPPPSPPPSSTGSSDYLPIDELGFPIRSPTPADIFPLSSDSSVFNQAPPAISDQAFDQLPEYISSPYFMTSNAAPAAAQAQDPAAASYTPAPRQYRSKSFSAWEDRSAAVRQYQQQQQYYSGEVQSDIQGDPNAFSASTAALSSIMHPVAQAAHPYSSQRFPKMAPASFSRGGAGGGHDANLPYLSFASFPPPQSDIQPSSSSDEENGNSSGSDSQDSVDVKKPQRKKAKGPNGEPLPRVKRVPYKILKTLASEQYDELVVLEVRELRSRLAANFQPTKGLQMDLMARIADAYLNGCLPMCPHCHRYLVVPVLDGGYVCQSSIDPTTAGQCHFATAEIQRTPWRVKEGCAI